MAGIRRLVAAECRGQPRPSRYHGDSSSPSLENRHPPWVPDGIYTVANPSSSRSWTNALAVRTPTRRAERNRANVAGFSCGSTRHAVCLLLTEARGAASRGTGTRCTPNRQKTNQFREVNASAAWRSWKHSRIDPRSRHPAGSAGPKAIRPPATGTTERCGTAGERPPRTPCAAGCTLVDGALLPDAGVMLPDARA